MLPLVLMPGAGSELYRGLGSVVVGGLVVSTIFTLILVPVLLSLVLDLEWRGKQATYDSPSAADVPTIDQVLAYSSKFYATQPWARHLHVSQGVEDSCSYSDMGTSGVDPSLGTVLRAARGRLCIVDSRADR